MTEPPHGRVAAAGVSRRRLLLGTGGGVLAAGAAGVGGYAIGRATAPERITAVTHHRTRCRPPACIRPGSPGRRPPSPPPWWPLLIWI